MPSDSSGILRRRTRSAVVVVALLSGADAFAQAVPAATQPAFEVVSVKPNTNHDVPEAIALQPDGSVRFTAFPLATLIAMAYRAEGIQRFDQLVGGPSWMRADRFDVGAKTATAPGAARTTPADLPAMLRGLLRDRFALRVHTEERPMPAFALVIARRDRGPAAGLRASTIDCAQVNAGAAQGPDSWCGIRAAGGVITGHAVSAAMLAGNLAGYPAIDRFVTDRTGLTGRYDFRLEYSPAFLQPGDTGGNAGPSLFTALTEQLGLTLQPETLTVPVL